MDFNSIPLGKTKEGRTVSLSPKTRSTHIHIIGSSGEGKSKFMEHLIRKDIINNNGLCLIDPHGHLYNDIVRWCETKGMLDRRKPKKIILFDPSEKDWTFGFNPLQADRANLAFHVDAMVNAVAKVWGGENQDQTPLLKRCLRILFYVLAEKNLSLLEAQHLINPVGADTRSHLTSDLVDSIIKQEWDYFNTLKPKPFYDEFGSTINRMMEFLSSPIIRSIIGQTERTIDFRKIMDQGWIVLINLSSADRLSDDNARLLGTLIVNDLLMKAKGRSKGSKPFYLYIDECGRYVNEDTARILDECRKFGLHLILAHQHLEQLKKAGEEVYHAVMTDAKTKVIFGGLSFDDAEAMAKNTFLGELDLQEWKDKLKRPAVVRYNRTWFENYAKSSGHSEGYGSSLGIDRGTTSGQGDNKTVSPDGDIISTGTSSNIGISTTESTTDSYSSSETESEIEGKSQGLEPELQSLPLKEYSLEEQIYKAMALMVNQPTQHAIIKLPKKKSRFIRTPTVKAGYANDQRVSRFKKQCYNLTDCVNPRAQIEQEIEVRQQRLLAEAKRAKEEREEAEKNKQKIDEPKSFWEDKAVPLTKPSIKPKQYA